MLSDQAKLHSNFWRPYSKGEDAISVKATLSNKVLFCTNLSLFTWSNLIWYDTYDTTTTLLATALFLDVRITARCACIIMTWHDPIWYDMLKQRTSKVAFIGEAKLVSNFWHPHPKGWDGVSVWRHSSCSLPLCYRNFIFILIYFWNYSNYNIFYSSNMKQYRDRCYCF